MTLTTVVNIYHKAPYDVYIGRAGKGQNGFFGNPFRSDNRDESIARFKDYFFDRLKTDPEFRFKVHQLKGKVLGCFCFPRKCHGSIIAEYLNRLPETHPIKFAVIGSRTFNNYQYMCDILQWYEIKQIISGGAKGADSLAKKYALEHGIQYREFLPNWNLYGKRAGFLRNEQIVDACEETICFWDGFSPGSKNSIELAQKQGKPVSIFWPEKETADDFLLNIGF